MYVYTHFDYFRHGGLITAKLPQVHAELQRPILDSEIKSTVIKCNQLKRTTLKTQSATHYDNINVSMKTITRRE